MSAKIDIVQNTSGQELLVDGYPRQPGRIIEYLTGMCDGSTVRVASGTYRFQQVSAAQISTTTYTTIRGSVIDYVPPIGTTAVTYRYHFTSYWDTDHAINDYKFFIDGEEVLFARHNRGGRYIEDRYTFEWVIDIGGTANANTGRQATWTSPKTLYMQFRHYGGSNDSNLNGTYYWDGAGGNQFSMPQLSIIATA